ncbi:MAG: flippase-like domain-containing protein [Alphaproteobacteria bacterium GM7ARS4]|nr:flippase-like domain-containing protein [Alphaproteobacteria bacterium GM7ARS4]
MIGSLNNPFTMLKKLLTVLFYLATTIAGLGLLIWLIDDYDMHAIMAQWGHVGVHGYMTIVLYHMVTVALSALAWWYLHPSLPFLAFFEARTVRESAKLLLPLAQIGGDMIGMRLLILRGGKATPVITATVGDITLEIVSLFLFIGLAIISLAFFYSEHAMAHIITAFLIGWVLAFFVLCAFVIAQRYGLLHLIDNAILAISKPLLALKESSGRASQTSQGSSAPSLMGLHASLKALYERPSPLFKSFTTHLIAWVVSGTELWLIFWLIDAPITFTQSLILEALVQAIKSAAFIVPAAIGVQEGAFILVGSALGIGGETALLASLMTRGRHLLQGIPSLLWWHMLESHRLRRNTHAQNSLT